MNRKPRTDINSSSNCDDFGQLLQQWQQQIISRRHFLIRAAGGSLAALFPVPLIASENEAGQPDLWPVINSVQMHLFPHEKDAPGARDFNALGYLKFVVTDTTLGETDRKFILLGASWLEDMARQLEQASFTELDEAKKESVLRAIAASDAGNNWLSTILLYIMEALLTDPVYGGNTNSVGWNWLQHIPGFPRPPKDKTFPRLLS